MDFILKFGKKIRKIIKKIKKWALDSKLNMSVLSCGLLIFTLGLVICLIVIFRGGVDNTVVVEAPTTVGESTASLEVETTLVEPADDEKFTTEINISDTSNFVNNPTKLSIKLTVKDSGAMGDKFFTQYSLKIKNVSDKTIDGWAIVLRNGQVFDLSDNWNAQYSAKNGELVILPYPDNERIVSGQEINIGFVVISYNYLYFKSATVFVGDYNESFNVTVNKYASEGTFTTEETSSDTEITDEETTTPDNETETSDDSETSETDITDESDSTETSDITGTTSTTDDSSESSSNDESVSNEETTTKEPETTTQEETA